MQGQPHVREAWRAALTVLTVTGKRTNTACLTLLNKVRNAGLPEPDNKSLTFKLGNPPVNRALAAQLCLQLLIVAPQVLGLMLQVCDLLFKLQGLHNVNNMPQRMVRKGIQLACVWSGLHRC